MEDMVPSRSRTLCHLSRITRIERLKGGTEETGTRLVKIKLWTVPVEMLHSTTGHLRPDTKSSRQDQTVKLEGGGEGLSTKMQK
jgi:hypothetical protein